MRLLKKRDLYLNAKRQEVRDDDVYELERICSKFIAFVNFWQTCEN